MMQVLNGILLLVRFNAEGFRLFTATPLGFMNSLAPMLGISVVAGMRPLLSGNWRALVLHVLTTAIALLAPPVLSHVLARAWKREAVWMRYAVAFNWCQAVVTLVTVVLVLMLAAGGGVSRSGEGAGVLAAVAAVVVYWLVLCWFMAWRGLGVGGFKAVLAVVVINMGTGALVMGPSLVLGAMGGRGVVP